MDASKATVLTMQQEQIRLREACFDSPINSPPAVRQSATSPPMGQSRSHPVRQEQKCCSCCGHRPILAVRQSASSPPVRQPVRQSATVRHQSATSPPSPPKVRQQSASSRPAVRQQSARAVRQQSARSRKLLWLQPQQHPAVRQQSASRPPAGRFLASSTSPPAVRHGLNAAPLTCSGAETGTVLTRLRPARN